MTIEHQRVRTAANWKISDGSTGRFSSTMPVGPLILHAIVSAHQTHVWSYHSQTWQACCGVTHAVSFAPAVAAAAPCHALQSHPLAWVRGHQQQQQQLQQEMTMLSVSCWLRWPMRTFKLQHKQQDAATMQQHEQQPQWLVPWLVAINWERHPSDAHHGDVIMMSTMRQSSAGVALAACLGAGVQKFGECIGTKMVPPGG